MASISTVTSAPDSTVVDKHTVPPNITLCTECNWRRQQSDRHVISTGATVTGWIDVLPRRQVDDRVGGDGRGSCNPSNGDESVMGGCGLTTFGRQLQRRQRCVQDRVSLSHRQRWRRGHRHLGRDGSSRSRKLLLLAQQAPGSPLAQVLRPARSIAGHIAQARSE